MARGDRRLSLAIEAHGQPRISLAIDGCLHLVRVQNRRHVNILNILVGVRAFLDARLYMSNVFASQVVQVRGREAAYQVVVQFTLKRLILDEAKVPTYVLLEILPTVLVQRIVSIDETLVEILHDLLVRAIGVGAVVELLLIVVVAAAVEWTIQRGLFFRGVVLTDVVQ